MHPPLVAIARKITAWVAILGSGLPLLDPSRVFASPDNSNAPYVMVKESTVIPVKNVSDQPAKHRGETLYLNSAVRVATSHAAPPKQSPTPSQAKGATPVPKTPSAATAVTVTVRKKSDANVASDPTSKPSAPKDDDIDDYRNRAVIADPIQPVNRGFFWFNHQLYRYILKPVSRVYDTVLPPLVRTGIYNVFDNLEYPDRFVNDLLQARFTRAGQETEKFVVNTVAGVGGLMKISDKIPSLSDIPRTDTGATFATWGFDHGFYIVWPVLGPKSLRDTVGFAGDYALSPLAWCFFLFPGAVWTTAVTTPDSARTLHGRMNAYDAATQHSLDPYLALRSSYIQNRKKAVSK